MLTPETDNTSFHSAKTYAVSDDDDVPLGTAIGRGCAWCVMNHIDVPMFFLSFLVLYLSVNRCCFCVLVVAIVSALMCVRFRIMNATLWSAIFVLYMHKDWDVNFGSVRLSWNRPT